MHSATWKQWSPFQNPTRSRRKRWDECSVFPIWETLWISAILCNILFFWKPRNLHFIARYVVQRECWWNMNLKWNENENQNVIRLKSIIVEANWKINAEFQHKPNATFVILLVWNVLLKGNQGEKQMLLPSMSWTALVTLPGTVIHYMLYFFWDLYALF